MQTDSAFSVNPDVAELRQPDHDILPAFLNRWSPRAFSPEPVNDETLMRVFEAARWAASSYNEQPWRFLVARTPDDHAKFLNLLNAANQAWAKNAPVLYLIISKRTFTHNNQPNASYQFDAGTSSGYISLQATLEGLYVHGMAGFDRDRARTELGIPDDFDPIAMYALGKIGDKEALPPPVREREIPSGRRPLSESFREGGFLRPEETQAEADTQNNPAPPSKGDGPLRNQ